MKYIEIVKAVREGQMKKEASVKKLASMIGMRKKSAGIFDWIAGIPKWFRMKNTVDENKLMDHPGNRNYIRTVNTAPGTLTKGVDLNVSTPDGVTTKPIKQADSLAEVRANQAATQSHLLQKDPVRRAQTQSTLQRVGRIKQSLPASTLKDLQKRTGQDYISELLKHVKDPRLQENIRGLNDQVPGGRDALRFQVNNSNLRRSLV